MPLPPEVPRGSLMQIVLLLRVNPVAFKDAAVDHSRSPAVPSRAPSDPNRRRRRRTVGSLVGGMNVLPVYIVAGTAKGHGAARDGQSPASRNRALRDRHPRVARVLARTQASMVQGRSSSCLTSIGRAVADLSVPPPKLMVLAISISRAGKVSMAADPRAERSAVEPLYVPATVQPVEAPETVTVAVVPRVSAAESQTLVPAVSV